MLSRRTWTWLIGIAIAANLAFVAVKLSRRSDQPALPEEVITDPAAVGGPNDLVYRQCRRQGQAEAPCLCLARAVAQEGDSVHDLIRLVQQVGASGMQNHMASLPKPQQNRLLGPTLILRSLMERCALAAD